MVSLFRRWLFRRRFKSFKFHAVSLADGGEFTLRALANFERDAILLALTERRVSESVVRMQLVRDCCMQHYKKSIRQLGMSVPVTDVAALADNILELSGMTEKAQAEAEKKPEAVKASDSIAS